MNMILRAKRFNVRILATAIFTVVTAPSADAQTHVWSQRFGGATVDFGFAVAADGAGNAIMTGYFEGAVDFGGGNLPGGGPGSPNIILAKYNSSGTHQWSQAFGSSGFDAGYSVAVDGLGNIYLTGTFQGTVNFGGSDLVSAGGLDIFLAKFNSAGVHQWSLRFGQGLINTRGDRGISVAVDCSGNVFLLGQFEGTVNFGGSNLVSAGDRDIILAKYDTAGIHQWSQRFGHAGEEAGSSLAVDGLGNAVITGFFEGTVDFGGGPLSSAGAEDVFLAKYNSAGIHQWSQRFGNGGSDQGSALAVDAAGNVIVTGGFEGTVNFGGGPLTSAGSADIFLAKYDASGTHRWSERFGATNSEQGSGLAVDSSGNVIITGSFDGTVDLGGGPLTSAGTQDVFLAKYSSAGAHSWSKHFGEIGHAYGNAVAIDGSANVCLTGIFDGTINFGGSDLVSAGDNLDIFLARFTGDNPLPVLISSFEARSRESGIELAWRVRSDDSLERFVLYRRDSADSEAREIAEGPIDAAAQSYLDKNVGPGHTYYYDLLIRSRDGDVTRSAMASATVPGQETALGQNHPNPFNPSTTIRFTLPTSEHVKLAIYDTNGRLVRTLVNDVRGYGEHEVTWNGRNDAGAAAGSGVYFYRLRAGKFTESKKMVLLK